VIHIMSGLLESKTFQKLCFLALMLWKLMVANRMFLLCGNFERWFSWWFGLDVCNGDLILPLSNDVLLSTDWFLS
jgi:hypothetical protein